MQMQKFLESAYKVRKFLCKNHSPENNPEKLKLLSDWFLSDIIEVLMCNQSYLFQEQQLQQSFTQH